MSNDTDKETQTDGARLAPLPDSANPACCADNSEIILGVGMVDIMRCYKCGRTSEIDYQHRAPIQAK